MFEVAACLQYGGKQLRTKVMCCRPIAKVKEETLKQGMFTNPAPALSRVAFVVSQTSGNPAVLQP
ncbi:hypothetical protein NXU92_22375 [Bacteroides fragilis]|nr:hypothetical protein [Bacteroides fragilis]